MLGSNTKRLYMKQTVIIFSLVSMLALSGGCASTKMTSFTDPDYRQTTFKRILILANTSDLERRLYFESTMAKVLLDVGVVAIEGFKLFPPTRNLTPERKVELLIQDSIDSYLSNLSWRKWNRASIRPSNRLDYHDKGESVRYWKPT